MDGTPGGSMSAARFEYFLNPGIFDVEIKEIGMSINRNVNPCVNSKEYNCRKF